MRILMVDAVVGNDYSLILCNHLKREGVDVALVTTEDRSVRIPVQFPVYRWAPSKQPEYGRVKKGLKYIRYLTRLGIHALSRRTDVLHFQFFRIERPEAFLFALLRICGARMVYTAHNILPHERKRGDTWVRTMVYRAANRIIVHSASVKKRLLQGFEIPEDKVAVISHGNFEYYRTGEEISRQQARKIFNLSDSDQVLLFFGFIRPYKGLDLLLKAYDIACRKEPNLHLLIAGQCASEKMEAHYRHQIDQMASRDRITFHPHFIPHEHLPRYFVATDWMVLPYLHIDHSGIVHMAYAYGRPVIATDVGGFREMIEEDGTGYIAAADNPVNLADTILSAASEPRAALKMGARGRLLGMSKYSWERAAQRTGEIYQYALDPR